MKTRKTSFEYMPLYFREIFLTYGTGMVYNQIEIRTFVCADRKVRKVHG